MKRRTLGFLSLAHGVTDLSPGGLPVLLPYLKAAFGLSYSATSVIMLLNHLGFSVSQPFIGYWSDRRGARWLMPVGCLFSAAGMALVGVTPSYWLILLWVGLSGLGTAVFHPDAYKAANLISPPGRRSTAMALFSVGGNVGFGLGPLFMAALVAVWGLPGTLGVAVPGVLMALVLWRMVPGLPGARPAASGAAVAPPPVSELWRSPVRGPLILLLGYVLVRSWVHLGLTAFIPLYHVTYLGGDPAFASLLLAAFLVAGGFGTVLAGPLADRWGRRPVMLVSMLLLVPLTLLFPGLRGATAAGLAAALGAVIVSTLAITVVYGQELLPRNLALAPGLVAGVGGATGGLGVAALGVVADLWGVPASLYLLVTLPILGFALAYRLPDPPSPAALRPAPARAPGRSG